MNKTTRHKLLLFATKEDHGRHGTNAYLLTIPCYPAIFKRPDGDPGYTGFVCNFPQDKSRYTFAACETLEELLEIIDAKR